MHFKNYDINDMAPQSWILESLRFFGGKSFLLRIVACDEHGFAHLILNPSVKVQNEEQLILQFRLIPLNITFSPSHLCCHAYYLL